MAALVLVIVVAIIAALSEATPNCYRPVQFNCFHAETRYRYDHDSKSCIEWTACPGSGNNFGSMQECETACGAFIQRKPRNVEGETSLSLNAEVNTDVYYSMVEKTAIPLPFIQEIGSAQLVDGKAISIKGEVTGDEFHFDLADGANPSGASTSNYAIDVSYRGSEGWVVNTKIDGAWQTEDRYPVGEGIGNKREIYIRIEPHQDYFAIFVNGQKLGELNYIMPLDRVSWVYVSGDLNLHQIQFEDNFYMVPFIYDFSGPFEIGKSLYVTGLPDKDANEFYIVLRTDDENVPFILNPRFSVETVVRNTERDGKWMDEERDGDFPFTKDEVFDLVIEVNDDGYSIYVNGNEFQTYYHRAPVSSVKQLEINGDVQISNVDYK